MPTQEVRTIMYSKRTDPDHEGEVIVHKLPFNANTPQGMQKLKNFVNRGFTFQDPRTGSGLGIPQTIVTRQVNIDKPEGEEIGEKTDKPLLPCPVCGKNYKGQDGLYVHMRKHEKQK